MENHKFGHGKSQIWSCKVMEKSWNSVAKILWEPCKLYYEKAVTLHNARPHNIHLYLFCLLTRTMRTVVTSQLCLKFFRQTKVEIS